jgi:hypothetical protein
MDSREKLLISFTVDLAPKPQEQQDPFLYRHLDDAGERSQIPDDKGIANKARYLGTFGAR